MYYLMCLIARILFTYATPVFVWFRTHPLNIKTATTSSSDLGKLQAGTGPSSQTQCGCNDPLVQRRPIPENIVYAITELLHQHKSLSSHGTRLFPLGGKHIELVQYPFNVIAWSPRLECDKKCRGRMTIKRKHCYFRFPCT